MEFTTLKNKSPRVNDICLARTHKDNKIVVARLVLLEDPRDSDCFGDICPKCGDLVDIVADFGKDNRCQNCHYILTERFAPLAWKTSIKCIGDNPVYITTSIYDEWISLRDLKEWVTDIDTCSAHVEEVEVRDELNPEWDCTVSSLVADDTIIVLERDSVSLLTAGCYVTYTPHYGSGRFFVHDTDFGSNALSSSVYILANSFTGEEFSHLSMKTGEKDG